MISGISSANIGQLQTWFLWDPSGEGSPGEAYYFRDSAGLDPQIGEIRLIERNNIWVVEVYNFDFKNPIVTAYPDLDTAVKAAENI